MVSEANHTSTTCAGPYRTKDIVGMRTRDQETILFLASRSSAVDDDVCQARDVHEASGEQGAEDKWWVK